MVKKNKVRNNVMPATQLWLQFIHGTVYGQQMVHIKPPHNPTGMLTHKLHCSTKAFTVAQKKLTSSICRQDMKACFISASLANWLSARCLFMGPNRWNSLGMKLVLQGPPNHTTTTSHKSRWQWMWNVIICEVPWWSTCSLCLVIQPVTDSAAHTGQWNIQHCNIRQPHLSVLCDTGMIHYSHWMYLVVTVTASC